MLFDRYIIERIKYDLSLSMRPLLLLFALFLSVSAFAADASNTPPPLLAKPTRFEAAKTAKPEIIKGKHLINEIVAVVNDEPITSDELDNEVLKVKAQLNSTPEAQLPDALTLKRQVLQQLINQTIALQMAKRQGISVSDSEVDASITEITAQNGISQDALKQKLAASGLDFSDYFNTIKKQLIINKLEQRAIMGKIYIPPRDIQKYIDQHFNDQNTLYRVDNILLPLPEGATSAQKSAALKKAAKIVADVKANKISFEEAARKYSKSSNADNGGKLGEKILSELPTIYSEKVKQMSEGTISKPFIANNGVQIIYLAEKRVPDDKKHYIDEYHVYQIVIKTSPIVDSGDAKAKLMRIITAINNGQRFSTLARANSQNHDNADSGGDMGWVSLQTLPMALAEKIRTSPIDVISQPFQVNNSWQIIKVTAKRKKDNTAAYQEEEATNALFQQNAAQVLKTWMMSLRDSAYVDILNPELKLSE